jgi:hypothetical protein
VWSTKPAFQFIALAKAKCTICKESVMRPTSKYHRYPGAHSCIKCEGLCCAACSCQCTCLSTCSVIRDEDLDRDVEDPECTNCRGWCHLSCAEFDDTIYFCGFCQSAYCDHCWGWYLRLCSQCEEILCNECVDMSWCNGCNESYCDECRDVASCQSCNSSFCSTCRVVAYCETCETSYCDSCGH